MTEEQAAFHFGEPACAYGEVAAAPPACDRRRLAYHQAGHAVAAHALGWRIVGLTLDESGGCCYSRPPIRVRPRPLSEAELERDRRRARARVLWADVTITLAGMMAERLATGDVHPRALPEE